jgi:hypothetical protein
MRPVVDLRFDHEDWPIKLVVPAKDAETWMAHLNAEREARGWSSSGFSQLHRTENSGSLSVHTANGPSPPAIDVVWEKLRKGDLRLRARPSGTPLLSLEVAQDFIDATSARQRVGTKLREYHCALLAYNGLPWCGELWLDSELRLGPPSKHPTDALLGPQAIIVDAMVEGIGNQGIKSRFEILLNELRVFLSVVLGLHVKTIKLERRWVCQLDEQGRIEECKLGHVGYWETSRKHEFPAVGHTPPIARREVSRPGLGRTGIWSDMNEQWVPADIEELWQNFNGLPNSKREQFLGAGNAYLIARSMWPDQRTAYAVFLVVACEALKPSGKRYDRIKFYDVVASLVNRREAELLKELSVPPQRVRNNYVHCGELAADELLPMLIHNQFQDPSFDELIGELSGVSRTCLIEWLRCSGKYKV